MKGFFFQLFFILILLECKADGKAILWGQVRDTEGRPIEQAVVCIVNTTTGVVTNQQGNYRLPLTPGQHRIAVSSLGFTGVQTDINIKESLQFNFTLQTDNIRLESVDIQAKSKNQQMRETVFAINALDVKSLANNSSNLAEIVGRSSGVNIRREGGMGSSFDLSINGLSGNAIRYFLDGIALESMGSGTNLSNIPLNLIERVEIYKGVVPIHLGTDALGGAMNFITKKQFINYLDFSYSYGSFNSHQADVISQFKIGSRGIVVRPSIAISYSDNDYTMHNIEIWNAAEEEYQKKSVRRFHDGYASKMGRVEAGVTEKWWTDAFFISASISQSDKELQTGSTQSVVYGRATRENRSTGITVTYRKNNFIISNLTTDIAYSHTWDERSVVDTTYRQYRWDGSYINSSRNEITGRGKSLRNTSRPLNMANVGLSYHWVEKNTVGLNYTLNSMRNKLSDEVDAEFNPSDDRFDKHITGLSYNREWVSKRLNHLLFVKNYTSYLNVNQLELSWITGADELKGSITTSDWGGGTGLRYQFSEALSFKTSIEKSFRLPLANEVLGNSTTIYPNYRIKPESSMNINLGLSGLIQSRTNHRLSYEISGFIRKVEDYIRLQISESEGMSQYQNVNNVSIRGMESELHYSAGKAFEAMANISYLYEVNKTKFQNNGKPEITYNNRMPNRPWLYANGGISYHLFNPLRIADSKLTLGYDLRYVHWFYLTWEGYGALKAKSTIPTQWISNASVNYSWCNDRYSLTFNCDNLFDNIVYDKYKLQKPGREFSIRFKMFINSL